MFFSILVVHFIFCTLVLGSSFDLCHTLIIEDNLEEFKKLDLFHLDNKNNLHLSAYYGSVKVTEYLLSIMTSTSTPTPTTTSFLNIQGETPFHVAASKNNPKVMELLIRQGGYSMDQPSFLLMLPIELAINNEAYDSAIWLLENGCSINHNLILPIFSSQNQLLIISFLQRWTGDVDEKHFMDNTFLNLSALFNLAEVAAYLLEIKKASCMVPNSHGLYPIHVACAKSIDVVKVLLRNGADKEVKCFAQGYTPLAYAFTTGNPDIEDLLLENGAIGHFTFPNNKK